MHAMEMIRSHPRLCRKADDALIRRIEECYNRVQACTA